MQKITLELTLVASVPYRFDADTPMPSMAVASRPTIETQVKKILSSFFILMVTFGSAQADIVYVTDNLNLSLRSEENNTSKVVKLLPTGTPLTLIKKTKSPVFYMSA